MTLISGTRDKNEEQGLIAKGLKNFAEKYKSVVMLVSHPRKVKKDEVFDTSDIGGASEIGNLADIVLSVERPNIRITKNREFGERRLIQCSYNPANRRIFQTKYGDRIKYGWNHEGVSLPEVQACKLKKYQVVDGVVSVAGTQPF